MIWLRWFAGSLAILLCVSAVAEQDGELLRNGALSMDRNGDGSPDGWAFARQRGAPEGAWTTTAEGTRALKVTVNGPGDVGYWSQVVRLDPWMRRLRVAVALRTEGAARASVSLSAYDVEGKWLAADYKLVVVEKASEWRAGEAEFSLPEGAAKVRIAAWGHGLAGGGAALCRHLSLTCLDAPPERPQGNLLTNGDFETDADGNGRADGWSLSGYRGSQPRPAEAPQAHLGRGAVGLHVKDGETALYWRWMDVDTPWTCYRISAWMRTEGAARASFSLTAYDESGQKWLGAAYGLGVVGGAAKFTRRAGYFTPPPGTGRLKVALWANYGGGGEGSVWFDDVEVVAVDSIPPTPYLSPNRPPEPDGAAKRRGFAVFLRDYLRLMPPTYTPSPEELGAPLEVAACRGEFEPLSIGVFALASEQTITGSLSPLLNAQGARLASESVSWGVVRLLIKRSHYAMNDRLLVPTYIEKTNQLICPARESRQFWLTFHVPDDAPPGVYRGKLTLRSSAGAWTGDVSVTVHSFRLPPVDSLALGMYDGLQRTHPGDDFLAHKYADMRAHGMTTVGFCSGVGAPMELRQGEAVIGWNGESPLERAMAAYQRAGFPQPMVWLMAGDVGALAEKAGPVESEAYARAYKSIIRGIVDHGKRQGWPEVIFQPRDEVFAHESRFERGFRELKLLKECGVRTEMDGTNVGVERPAAAYPFTDVLVHAYGPLLYGKRVYGRDEWRQMVDRYHRDGKRIWFYNFDTTGYHVETMRFAYGLYLLATGADGLLSWAYSWGDEDPYDDYSGPRGDTVFFYPPMDDRLGGPGLGWEGIREGVDDYRYALALQQAIQAHGAHPVAAQARRWLDDFLPRVDLGRLRVNRSMQGDWTKRTISREGESAVSGDFKVDVGLSFDDYRLFRREAAGWISKLLAVRE